MTFSCAHHHLHTCLTPCTPTLIPGSASGIWRSLPGTNLYDSFTFSEIVSDTLDSVLSTGFCLACKTRHQLRSPSLISLHQSITLISTFFSSPQALPGFHSESALCHLWILNISSPSVSTSAFINLSSKALSCQIKHWWCNCCVLKFSVFSPQWHCYKYLDIWNNHMKNKTISDLFLHGPSGTTPNT